LRFFKIDPFGLSGICPLKNINKIIENAKAGKVREASNYHGRLGRARELEILSNPEGVYQSSGTSGRLTFRKGEYIVITEGIDSRKGQLVTSYGPARPRGKSGAAIFGGEATDAGLPVTHDMITQGKVPVPSGGFEPPAVQVYP
jgi:hypothetical protein